MKQIAIDIGSTNLKLMKLSKHGKQWQAEAALVSKSPMGGILSSAPEAWQALADEIIKLKKAAKIGDRKVVASMPESEVFTRAVIFPKMTEKELETAVAWEAEQYVPLPIEEVNYSYLYVGDRPDGSLQVLIVAAPKKVVEKYTNIFDRAGLDFEALETELTAVSRTVASLSSAMHPVMMVADMGARTTDIGIVRGGNLVFSRSISTAGSALTRTLMINLQLDEQQAENYKQNYGLKPMADNPEVANLLQQVVNVIADEMHKTLRFYETRNEGEKIEQIMLTGGTAQMPGLAEYFGNRMGMNTQVMDVFAAIKPKEGRPVEADKGAMFAITTGLSLRG